jgi:hypothetical protein
MKRFLLLGLITVLAVSCAHDVKIVRKNLDKSGKYFNVSSDEFFIREPSNDIPFKLYAQYNYEKKVTGERFIFGIKFLGGFLPRIESVKISVDGYEQQCMLTRFPVGNVEGVTGISETVFFVVPEELIEEIIRTRKAFFVIKGYKDFRFFYPQTAIDVLQKFYDKVIEES